MARCIECGFLAARDTTNRDLSEVDQDFRDSVLPAVLPGGRFYAQERAPVCFVQADDLHRDLLGNNLLTEAVASRGSKERAQLLDSQPGDRVLEVLRRERPQCDENQSFMEWVQGFSPKEHREMLDRKQMHEREEARLGSERKWKFAEAILFIVAGAITAIVGAMVQRGEWF